MKASQFRPLLMDTHAWLWHAAGNKALGLQAQFLIGAAIVFSEAMVSVASCWEIGQLERKGRIALNGTVRSWMYRSIRGAGLKVVALRRRQVMEAIDMIGVITTKDPFDAFIVAAAIHCGADLVTADQRIAAFAASTGKLRIIDARK